LKEELNYLLIITIYLYVFNRKGVIINTTKTADLGFNFYDLGESYEDFLKNVWKSKSLAIERVGLETATKTPIKYAYQAIDNDFLLEIGIKYESIALI